MDKKKFIIILLIIICLTSALIFYINSLRYEITDDAYIEGDMVQISSRVSGQIEEIYIDDNQKIKEGDIVAKIDDRDYKIKLEQAQAQYEKILFSQKASKARLNAVNSEIFSLEKDLNRYKKLYETGAVSQQTLDNAQTRFDNAKAKLTLAEEEIISTSGNKSIDADLKALKAQRDMAELHLEYTNIKSPIAGTVTNKNFNKGKFVQIGQPLFTIVSDNIWIEANFKENQVGKMKIGQDVEVKIDAYPNKKFKGKIESIQKASGAKSSLFPPENATGSFVKIVQRIPVKIVFTEKIDTEKYNIVIGMSVIPKVKIKKQLI